jgi:transcriptional regulator with GAF, ATPase, and Fis domain
MDPLNDQWRTDVNRAVRDFAPVAADLDEETLRAFLNTMLREIGEAVGVECCALIEEPGGGCEAAPEYWCRIPVIVEGEHPIESVSFAATIRTLAVDSEPLVLRTEVNYSDPAIAEAQACLVRAGIGAALLVPVVVAMRTRATWLFGAASSDHIFPEPVVEHLQTMSALVWSALNSRRRQGPGAPGATPTNVARLPIKARPAPPIRNAFAPGRDCPEIVGESAVLRAALDAVEQVADADSSVLLLGETGTGKELFARALHARSPRFSAPLVCVNCAALPPTLIETELFGHQRGAFTGAVAVRQGRFELAHKGTLFLDEIGDLPLDLQAKLLRVLQEGGFERVGSSQTQAVDVRIIGATHRDIGRAVSEGEFRADLYYRLNVFPIRVPALRERKEDIPALVWSIIRKRQTALRRHISKVPAEAIRTLQQHSWPGNIRELENVVERALIHSTGDTLVLLESNLETLGVELPADTLTSVERAHIETVLRDCGWRINGFGNAAERLGLHPNTLRFRMKKLGIVRHEPAREVPRMRAGRASVG